MAGKPRSGNDAGKPKHFRITEKYSDEHWGYYELMDDVASILEDHPPLEECSCYACDEIRREQGISPPYPEEPKPTYSCKTCGASISYNVKVKECRTCKKYRSRTGKTRPQHLIQKHREKRA